MRQVGFRLLELVMLAGLVVGCSMEGAEPAGVLSVDSNRGVAVPEGLSARDFDFNNDKVVDILDLVIASKFVGQAVTEEEEADAVAAVTEDADESEPCLEIATARNPDIEAVDDNAEFKETFEAPGGGKYAYALLAMRKARMYGATPEQLQNRQTLVGYQLPSCVAVRFLLGNLPSEEKMLPQKMMAKPVSGHEVMFSDPITSPLLTFDNSVSYFFDIVRNLTFYHYNDPSELTANRRKQGAWNWADWRIDTITGPADFTQVSPVQQIRTGIPRMLKTGIPIGNETVIQRIWMPIQEDNLLVVYNWKIHYSSPNNYPIDNLVYGHGGVQWAYADKGIYINMSPTEVRRRYFPEDID